MFIADSICLTKLLADVSTSKIQLPDFQRDWIWDDDNIKELLISIARGYPIGAIMVLDAGGEVQFKCRPIEGVKNHEDSKAGQYLLDGQQRLTSLFQSLMQEGPVETLDRRDKDKKVKRWYFFNIQAFIGPIADSEDVIVSIPEDKIETKNIGREVIRDLSSNDKEYELHMMPSGEILEPSKWILNYNKFWNSCRTEHPTGDPNDFLLKFDSKVIEIVKKYKLPVICLDNKNSKEDACKVFEKVNTGGVSLTVFELLTAFFAANEFSLRKDWNSRREKLHEFDVLEGIEGDLFLQAVALLKTYKRGKEALALSGIPSSDKIQGVSCKKRDILSLSVDEYNYWADKLQKGFIKVAKFLHHQFIFKSRDLPYKAQLVPLAAIHVELDKKLEPANARKLLEKWFWSGIFGESYGGAVETRYARDLVDVVDWVNGGQTPAMIGEANLPPERLLSLRSRVSAAYKGLYALQMKRAATDWRTGQTLSIEIWNDNRIDIHHIFPKVWCKKVKPQIHQKLYDSIINKTPIDATTNRRIGGKKPSLYLQSLERECTDTEDEGASKLRNILKSHLINPEFLYKDDFGKFFVARGVELIQLINEAMGKQPISSGKDVFRDALGEYGISTQVE